MAKDKVAGKGADKPKKKTKASKAKLGGAENKKAKTASGKAKGASHSGFEAMAKLADHPMIAELIAVGATAAVAALAQRGMRDSKTKSTTAAKTAGKAAAAAIGARLMTEFQGVKDAAVKAARKS